MSGLGIGARFTLPLLFQPPAMAPGLGVISIGVLYRGYIGIVENKLKLLFRVEGFRFFVWVVLVLRTGIVGLGVFPSGAFRGANMLCAPPSMMPKGTSKTINPK